MKSKKKIKNKIKCIKNEITLLKNMLDTKLDSKEKLLYTVTIGAQKKQIKLLKWVLDK